MTGRVRSRAAALLSVALTTALLTDPVAASRSSEGLPRTPDSALVADGAALLLPPGDYEVPRDAVAVSNASGLASALMSGSPRDIVLAPGVYESDQPFQNASGHRLYAATRGSAILRAGLVIGGNEGTGGALVQGIAFDVSDPSRTLEDSVVHVWGRAGAGTRLLDSTFRGHRKVGAAIVVREPEGLVIQRISVRDFSHNGILIDANDRGRALSVPVLLEDLDVENVSLQVPRSSEGKAEACVWIGNTATLRRALLRNCAWMGLWTGTASNGSLVQDLDIDRTPVGVYLEHFTTRSTFARVRIGARVGIGMICEWADPSWGRRPACVDNVIENSIVASTTIGISLDEGTTRTTIRGVTFIGQRKAAIVDYRGIDNAYVDNDYGQAARGALHISYAHR